MTTKVLKVGAVKTGSKLCSRVTKESVSSMGRLPCLGDLLSPRRPRQDAKKSRGSRPVFLLSHPSSKCAKREPIGYLRNRQLHIRRSMIVSSWKIRGLE